MLNPCIIESYAVFTRSQRNTNQSNTMAHISEIKASKRNIKICLNRETMQIDAY